jgi:hypothetical protein
MKSDGATVMQWLMPDLREDIARLLGCLNVDERMSEDPWPSFLAAAPDIPFCLVLTAVVWLSLPVTTITMTMPMTLKDELSQSLRDSQSLSVTSRCPC